MKNYLLYITILFSLLSCVDDPIIEEKESISDVDVFVLCEGLWGSNNAQIYSYNNNLTASSIYLPESGLTLGDIGNEFYVRGDTIITVLTSSRLITFHSLTTRELFFELQLEGKSEPRAIAFNNEMIYVTDIIEDEVEVWNIFSKSLIKKYKVGPAPEGITYHDNKLYVVNSGYGQFRKDEEGASTLEIIDLLTDKQKRIVMGPNPERIKKVDDYLYISYINFWWEKESEVDTNFTGGIIQYSLTTESIENEWKVTPFDFTFDQSHSTMFILTENGLSTINLNDQTSLPVEVLDNGDDNWYGITYDSEFNRLWIANSKDFIKRGNILIYDLFSQQISDTLVSGYLPNKTIIL